LIVLDTQPDYAFCDSTAVAIWTDGYYWTGFTKGFRPHTRRYQGKRQGFLEKLFEEEGDPVRLVRAKSDVVWQSVYLAPDKSSRSSGNRRKSGGAFREYWNVTEYTKGTGARLNHQRA
jgi:hypothetical protein